MLGEHVGRTHRGPAGVSTDTVLGYLATETPFTGNTGLAKGRFKAPFIWKGVKSK